MTPVQAVVAVQDDVVANVAQFGMIVLARLDIDIFKGDMVAWSIFGAVQPDDSVLLGCSSDILEVDIVPASRVSTHQTQSNQ